MSIGNVNSASIKARIDSIVNSEEAGADSRKGKINILEQISNLGKEVLEALNVKDENLVYIEGCCDDVLSQFEELEKEISISEENINNLNQNMGNLQEKIDTLLEKQNSEKGLTKREQELLEQYQGELAGQKDNLKTEGGNMDSLVKQQNSANTKISNYGRILNDLITNMEDYAEAGNEIKQAASDYGRKHMAENLENKSGNGNALKRNESAWGRTILTHGIAQGFKNKTEKYVEQMGWEGMRDGADGINMTYHDAQNGGYNTEYDVKKYNIGGKLRDLTAKTWSYGKTVNTAANDLKRRAESVNNKSLPKDNPPEES